MINNMVLQPNGKLLISGEPSKIENIRVEGVSRLDEMGAPDQSFTPPVMGTNDAVSAILLNGDGSIVIGGQFINATAVAQHYLVGLEADGFFDPQDGWFKPTMLDHSVFCLSPDENGNMLVGGEFTDYGGSGKNALVRLNANGELDSSFSTPLPPASAVHSISVQADGKILIGGNFSISLDDFEAKHFVRLLPNGQLDTNYCAGIDDWVFATLALRDGGSLVGGVFKQLGDHTQKYLAKLSPDGQVDTGFAPDLGLLGWVYSMAEQADGKLLIGGEFTSIDDDEDVNHLARLNPDGNVDKSFEQGPGANESVKVLCLHPDGKIMIGGEFTEYNGEKRRHIARLNSDGSLDRGFGDE